MHTCIEGVERVSLTKRVHPFVLYIFLSQYTLQYRVRRKDLPIEKIVLLKNDKTYRLQNFKVYVEMYSNHNYMHKLECFRPRHT